MEKSIVTPNKMTFKETIIFILKKVREGIKGFFKLFFANKKATVGSIIFLFFIFIALFGQVIFKYDSSTDALNKFEAPSSEHWLGLDELGRDLFSQIVYGTKDVLTIAVLTSIFSVIFGVVLGMVSGLIGGITDKIIQLITNLFLSIPSFPMMLMMSAFLEIDNSITFALVLSMFNWAGLCRAIRAQVISIKERDFILICKVMNLSKAHIIFKELIPNVASYILINFILIMRNAIIGSVGIMMLGLASFDPANWGAILNRAKAVITSPKATLLWLCPTICIILIQMASLMLANGLDEKLNPRLKKN